MFKNEKKDDYSTCSGGHHGGKAFQRYKYFSIQYLSSPVIKHID